MFHFVHLSLRLLLFLLVALGVWVFTVKMTGEQKFVAGISEVFRQKFAADEIEIQGVKRERGKFTVHRLAMIDDRGSFFRGLEISNLICQRDFFVDFGKNWKPGIVEITKVNLSLRAGTDTDQDAQAIGDIIFQDMGSRRPDAIHVANISIRWGYNERSRGSISGSQMIAKPLTDGWRLSFRGGEFSQNWLKKLQIEELDMVVTRSGIRFDQAIFSKDGGSVVLEDLLVVAGQRPKISGQMKLRGIGITSMLPGVARAYVEGKISGDFKISGSTNTTDGLTFDGEVSLQEGDVITLRDRVPLLRALSAVDSGHIYRRVDFRIGSFRMRMQGKGLQLSGVKLFADDTMTLNGDLFVRKPKSDEELVLDDGSEFFGEIVTSDESAADMDISLSEAGGISNRNEIGFDIQGDKSLFGKLAELRQTRRVREFEAEKLTRSYRYEGEFKVSLMKSAFDRAPALKEAYPVDPDTGRILISAPIEGVLYEVTSDIANEIYEKGRRQ